MVNIDNILSEIEEDKSWREADLNFLENQLLNESDENIQKLITKPLILLLYANFEGHIKFIFQAYIRAINAENLTCNQVIYPLVASNLSGTFNDFKNPQRKPKPKKDLIFKKEHPQEFVELGRRIELLENLDTVLGLQINLNPDQIADTESNLTQIVMKKVVFRLGFDDSFIDTKLEEVIGKLLNFRNKIAHGSKYKGWTIREYNEVKADVELAFKAVRNEVLTNLVDSKYLK